MDNVFEFADIPWATVVIIVFVELAAMHRVDAEELRAFATAAGLLGIGHGIHTGAKNFAKRQDK
jgi:hypothetical protein